MNWIRVLCAAGVLSLAAASFGADQQIAAEFTELDNAFQATIRPLLKTHCLTCHTTDDPQGELDLQRFGKIDDVRKHPTVWIKAAEMLDNGEMPPKEALVLSAENRKAIRDWIDRYLKMEARASAGDPGPVVLRRLNNAEYTYTIRDLTGATLNPAREFPVDGASGEGFTNAGNALSMSPALFTKYLDAAKEISRHAVLLPDSIRFSNSPTPGDWTNEIVADIRDIYRRYSDSQGATRVNLQGIVFDTNDGGRLPIEKYLAVTIAKRQALGEGANSIDVVAAEHQLSPKYLAGLWQLLNSADSSPILDLIRRTWKNAGPSDVPNIAAQIHAWQNTLTRFQNVGHLKSWMVPNDPLTAQQEIRFKLTAPENAKTVTIYLSAGTAGDGHEHDEVVWQSPRIVTPGQPDLLLKDVRAFTREMLARRERLFAATKQSLIAAAAVGPLADPPKLAELAKQYNVDETSLAAWFDYLGIGSEATLKLDLFTKKLNNLSGYEFISGWEKTDALSIIANSSDQAVRVPGNMKPHAVAVHPSPSQQAAVGWLSPLTGIVTVQAAVTHAHPECGNGVTWSLELRRGATRRKLAAGISQGGKPVPVGPVESLSVQKGDLLSLLIGPRDANHSCDLTDIEFTIMANGQEWSLTREISPKIQAANPQADGFGNETVWHFYSEPVKDAGGGAVIPAGSVLARWQATNDRLEKEKLAGEVQTLLTGPVPADAASPDGQLHRQLSSLGGPLFAGARSQSFTAKPASEKVSQDEPGLDPRQFGKSSSGKSIDPNSLSVAAPNVIEVRLPADLVNGSEFVTTAMLPGDASEDASVQVQVSAERPANPQALQASLPVIAKENGAAWKKFQQGFAEFRRWFPAALCYSKIVPVDEVITLTLFHREDEPLTRLMLNDDEAAKLDRLWDELHFVSRDRLTMVDAYLQLMEYATQDRPDLVVAFEVFRKPINDGAAQFQQELLDAEPKHLDSVLRFANQAYRRPLSEQEANELRSLYQTFRAEELPHEEAIRFLIARVLVSPRFLYREEVPGAGTDPTPVSDWELASRLSYFLWSSQPDEELRALAAAGKLRDPDVLSAQAKRMLADSRVRRLATEFGCQWLHIYDFDQLDEKSEQHFPEFAELRDDMHEEAVRFLTDIFQRDRSLLDLLNADDAMLNGPLAKFYGVEGIDGPEWQRIAQWKSARGRGGVLGLAATLAKQSGASRTSPILRGNWVSEVLLGEKLPKPPKGVPPLPEDEAAETLTVRELTERHTTDERCSNCHRRIDPLGFALEGFDAIGRLRQKDLGDRPINTKTMLMDGTELNGLDGLRDYLANSRRDAFLRQFCRKFLGYALGRGVQLSDEPLLDEIMAQLRREDYRFGVVVEHIVRSPQFRMVRGREFVAVEE